MFTQYFYYRLIPKKFNHVFVVHTVLKKLTTFKDGIIFMQMNKILSIFTKRKKYFNVKLKLKLRREFRTKGGHDIGIHHNDIITISVEWFLKKKQISQIHL